MNFTADYYFNLNYRYKAIFLHHHPYEIFIPNGTRKLIVGTLPPPRFSTGALKANDVNFCYGSQDGMLWPVLEKIYRLKLLYNNADEAVEQRKEFLINHGLGICDIVSSCRRKKVDASDLGMQHIKLRNILGQIALRPTVETLLFMGGNSKNGPEYLFRQELKTREISLQCLKNRVPRLHSFTFDRRVIQTVSLTSPSNAANRAIGSTDLYKRRKIENPLYTTFEYRIEQYRKIFIDECFLEDDKETVL